MKTFFSKEFLGKVSPEFMLNIDIMLMLPTLCFLTISQLKRTFPWLLNQLLNTGVRGCRVICKIQI